MARFRTWMWTILISVALIVVMVALFPRQSRLKLNLAAVFKRPLLIRHHLSPNLKKTTPISHLAAENEQLRKELKKVNLQLKEASSENERLKNLLSFQRTSPLNLISAQVVGRDFSNWSKTILIDKGEEDGIRTGQAVVTPEGLAGKVSEAGGTLSKVMLLSDSNFRVSVILQDSREFGMVEGNSQGRIRIKYLELDSQPQRGESVITSGLDALVPEGILVGKIDEAIKEETRLYHSAFLLPGVDFSRLEEVLIVK